MHISYLIMLTGASILLVGFITSMAAPNAGNSTEVNDTIIEPVKNVTEAQSEPVEEITEEELTPEELMEIREGEMAEERALTTEEEGEQEGSDELIIEPVDTSMPEPTEDTTEDIIEPVQVTKKEIFVKEESKEPAKKEVERTSLKKTVNPNGFVFVGIEHAGKEVIISF